MASEALRIREHGAVGLWALGAIACAGLTGWAIAQPLAWLTAASASGLTACAYRSWRALSREESAGLDIARAFAAGDPNAGAGLGPLGRLLSQGVERHARDRRKAEAESRLLHTILDQLPNPVLGRMPDGAVRGFNAAGRRLLGADLVSAVESEGRLGSTLAARFAEGQASEIVLADFPSGPRRVRLARARIDGPGGAISLLAIMDIEAELDRAEMRAWRDQSRILTHEVLNGLTPVISLAQSAAGGAEGETAEALRLLERRAAGLLDFVQRYREAVQPIRVSRRRVLVRELLEDAAAGGAPAAQLQIEPPDLAADVDPGLLGRAIANLVRNARDALAEVDAPLLFLRAHEAEPGLLTIEVSDNGPGVDPDLGEDIFQPLFTTKRDGLGVGLAITRQAVSAHDGVLDWTANAGRGVTFRIRCR